MGLGEAVGVSVAAVTVDGDRAGQRGAPGVDGGDLSEQPGEVRCRRVDLLLGAVPDAQIAASEDEKTTCPRATRDAPFVFGVSRR